MSPKKFSNHSIKKLRVKTIFCSHAQKQHPPAEIIAFLYFTYFMTKENTTEHVQTSKLRAKTDNLPS